jgi:hypothetical protein
MVDKNTSSQKILVSWLGNSVGLMLGIFMLSTSAHAALLNLTLLDTPDIVSTFIDVTYDSGTDSFDASGYAMELDDDGSVPAEAISSGSFSLSATIDSSGVLSGGTLTIGGTVASLGFNSGTLLTGNLSAFGFPDAGGNPLEFLFNVTGGDAAGLYGGISTTGGIILSATGFTGDFASDFDNLIGGTPGTGSGVANVAPVPLPAAIWMFFSGLLGLMGLGQRRM